MFVCVRVRSVFIYVHRYVCIVCIVHTFVGVYVCSNTGCHQKLTHLPV